MDEAPGKVRPIASVIAVTVEAVPIVMQCPAVRAIPDSISRQSHSEMLPARSSSQYFHVSEPLPRVFPFQHPRIIGPAGKAIRGSPALIPPIIRLGSILSQPPDKTALSIG